MNNIISHLLSLRIINARCGDSMRGHFTDLIQNQVKLHREKILSFRKSRDELDQPYFHSRIEIDKYPQFSGTVHIILTLSHGQFFKNSCSLFFLLFPKFI